jgi:hypothetical protein
MYYAVLDISIILPSPTRLITLNNCGRALISAIPQAITPNPHTNLLNIYIYIKIANKMGFQPKRKREEVYRYKDDNNIGLFVDL